MSLKIPPILTDFIINYHLSALNAAEEIIIENHFKDRPEKVAVSIDEYYSKDLDDALYAYREGEFHIIEVSISDVTEVIHRNSILDIEALRRASSVYMQERVIHMFPLSLSTDKLSLNHQTERLALTCKVKLNDTFEVVDIDIFESVVYNRFRFDYQKFYKVINDESHELSADLNYFMYLAKELYKRRGHTYNFSDDDRKIGFSCSDIIQEGSPSFLVQEFMIFINKCVTIWMRERGINATFRNHMPEHKDTKYKGQMERAAYRPEMIHHLGLELDDYCHFTSPIRRYADIIVHRQIKAFLHPNKWKAYTYSEIRDLCLYINEQIYNLRKMQAVKEAEFESKSNIDISKRVLNGKYTGNYSSIEIHVFNEILTKFFDSSELKMSKNFKKETIKRLESNLIKSPELIYQLYLFNDRDISSKALYVINENSFFKGFFGFLEEIGIGFRIDYSKEKPNSKYFHKLILLFEKKELINSVLYNDSNKNSRKELSGKLFWEFNKNIDQIKKYLEGALNEWGVFYTKRKTKIKNIFNFHSFILCILGNIFFLKLNKLKWAFKAHFFLIKF